MTLTQSAENLGHGLEVKGVVRFQGSTWARPHVAAWVDDVTQVRESRVRPTTRHKETGNWPIDASRWTSRLPGTEVNTVGREILRLLACQVITGREERSMRDMKTESNTAH